MSKDKDCLFCKIAEKEIPSEVVYEDENIMAFNDIDPQAPTHIVIIPKDHYSSVLEVDNPEVFSNLLSSAVTVAKELGLDKEGFRYVINTGKDGGQTVNHLHLHLLGGRYLKWPPG